VQNVFLAMINEGFLSLYIRPVLAGDESDEEDETDFRPELYSYSVQNVKTRVSDKELQAAAKQRTSQSAFKMIILRDKPNSAMEREDNTQAIKEEMSGIEQQIVDFLEDLAKIYAKGEGDRTALRVRLIESLEVEISQDIEP